MSAISLSLKPLCLIIIACIITAYLPVLAVADTEESSSAKLKSADAISIKLEAEPRLQAPIRTMVGTSPQTYVIAFPQAMNQSSVNKAIKNQGNNSLNSQSVKFKWEFIWESPQLLKARLSISASNYTAYSAVDYQLNVNGSTTITNQVIKDAPIFTAIAQNSSQIWRYSVDGSRRELLASIDEPYNLSKLENDDRYYLATRFTQYCECDAVYEGLYALYDIKEHKMIRYPVALQTSYIGKGDFVVDSRGFFYEQPGNGVTLPQSNTTQTIHVEGYLHGANLSKDGKHIFMAVGTAEQEKDLTILLYSLEDESAVVLAKSLHGWVPESEVSSRKLPVQFLDVGKQVYFSLIEREGSYGELRYVYSWSDGQITAWNPPFAIEAGVTAGFSASSDDVYRLYANGDLYRDGVKITNPDVISDWQKGWIRGTHLMAATGAEQKMYGFERYPSWITLFDADHLTQTKLYTGLYTSSMVIGSSLDGQYIIVHASKPDLGLPLPPDTFGQKEGKYLGVVTPKKNPLISFNINNQKWKIVNPAYIEPNNALWIPLREVLEAAGWKVTWLAKEQTITGEEMGPADRVFKFKLGMNTGVFNGKQQSLIYAPKLIKGVVYIDAAILEKLEIKLNWNDSKRILFIDDIPDLDGITFADGSRYEGAMDGEIPSGLGMLFTQQGQLIYDGEFARGKFQGQGQLYDAAGTLIYSGYLIMGKANHSIHENLDEWFLSFT